MYMAADDEPTTSSNITQQCNRRTNSSTEEPTPTGSGEQTQPITQPSINPAINPDTEERYEGGIARDCTVCQNAPIARVILPCRHACVCHSCFSLLTRCPMCRGVIYSFFSLKPDVRYQEESTMEDGEEQDWMRKVENSCVRLNQWLGIHQ